MTGSHATLAGWEPRLCCSCGKRLVVSREALGFLYDHATGERFGWHTDCGSGPPKNPSDNATPVKPSGSPRGKPAK